MTVDTQTANALLTAFDKKDSVWLFAYGSLIYKVDFPYLDCCDAYIENWERRFWQQSHDHRGTPEKPGRVLTLIPTPGLRCHGRAFLIKPHTLTQLDLREKNGYLRHRISIHTPSRATEGLVYIAKPDNPAYQGNSSIDEIAGIIAKSIGPSGRNDEYVFKLCDALRKMRLVDEHVFAVERALRQAGRNESNSKPP